ncbi:hypothetical protein [Chitinimonas sp.]|uniref:PKD domain-containing protein n=1 Tax=Chitinimonas sp. TaxID=1934313 RepID=UPI0035B28BBF
MKRWLLMAFLLLAAKVHAANVLYLSSDAGDYIGGGKQLTLAEPAYTFQAFSNYLSVNGSDAWSVAFSGPAGAKLSKGSYPLARRAAFAGPKNPGLDVAGAGRSCVNLTGSFVVLEVEYDSSGDFSKLAADFIQHCEGDKAALRGAIRFNSSVAYDAPVFYSIALASPVNVIEGGQVALTADESFGLGGMLSAASWKQISGTPVVMLDNGSGQASFVAPPVGKGGEDLQFSLSVEWSAGTTSMQNPDQTVRIHVASKADPQTYVSLSSDAGDLIGQGKTQTLLPENFDFKVSKNVGNGVSLTLNGETSWALDFVNGSKTALTVGNYTNASRYPFNDNANGLDVSGDGRNCKTLTGSFKVLDIAYSGDTLSRLALDFEQYCDGNTSAALRGKVRINYASGSTIVANAGPTQTVQAGKPVKLDGQASRSASGAALAAYLWTQLSGTPVNLQNPAAAIASFTAPNIAVAETLVFRLEVKDQDGTTASANVSVNVMPAGPFSAISSRQGDNLTLAAVVQPPASQVGSNGNVYVVAVVNDQWWGYDGKGWAPFAGTNQPPAYAGVLGSSVQVPLLDNADVRGLSGVRVMVGYGVSVYEMMLAQRFAQVYTID